MKSDNAPRLIITASIEDARVRVDQFLAAKMPHLSRSLISKFIKLGSITTHDGLAIKPSQLVVGSEQFYFTQPARTTSAMKAEPIPLPIIFSDEHIAVVDKPAGLVTHPGAGVNNGTLCNALLYHFPGMTVGNVERPGIVHRLDKDTSGLIVIAKTEEAHRNLSEQFKDRRVEKMYRALCHGEFDETRFELKTGHARHHHHRLKFSTKLSLEKCDGAHVRLAHTSFRVEKSRYGFTMLIAHLHTGRTHQIRAHLADRDHPLLGDELYGGKRVISAQVPEGLRLAIGALHGQALHAEALHFYHPKTGEHLKFTVEPPEHFLRVVRFFDE
jgi:23S rRNA pseudouridine1911/1915/1917 synthase